jgi:hypothetical protein
MIHDKLALAKLNTTRGRAPGERVVGGARLCRLCGVASTMSNMSLRSSDTSDMRTEPKSSKSIALTLQCRHEVAGVHLCTFFEPLTCSQISDALRSFLAAFLVRESKLTSWAALTPQ